MTEIDVDNMEDEYCERFFLLEYVLQENYGWNAIEKCQITEDCDICMETLKDQLVMELPCGHVYHYPCIYITLLKYDGYKCPSCNRAYIHKKYKQPRYN